MLLYDSFNNVEKNRIITKNVMSKLIAVNNISKLNIFLCDMEKSSNFRGGFQKSLRLLIWRRKKVKSGQKFV